MPINPVHISIVWLQSERVILLTPLLPFPRLTGCVWSISVATSSLLETSFCAHNVFYRNINILHDSILDFFRDCVPAWGLMVAAKLVTAPRDMKPAIPAGDSHAASRAVMVHGLFLSSTLLDVVSTYAPYALIELIFHVKPVANRTATLTTTQMLSHRWFSVGVSPIS